MLVLKKISRSGAWNPSLASIPEHNLLFAMQRSMGSVDLKNLLQPARKLAEDTLEVNVDEKGAVGFRASKKGSFSSLLAFGFGVEEVVAQFCA
jgi:hypothetical protein